MSEKYKKFLEQKALLKEKHALISKELEDCEKEIELLRCSYSASFDDPLKICYQVPDKSVEPASHLVEDLDPAKQLFETDVTFDQAVALVQRMGSFDRYKNEWQCMYSRDSIIGIFEFQFTRQNDRDATVFARPHGLPAVLSRSGMRVWYANDCGHRADWKCIQYGMDGPIVEQAR